MMEIKRGQRLRDRAEVILLHGQWQEGSENCTGIRRPAVFAWRHWRERERLA